MSVRQGVPVETPDSELAAAMAGAALGAASGEPVAAPTLSADVPPITRTLVASVRASLSELCQEGSAATWRPSQESLKQIFQQRRFVSLDGAAEAQGELTSVVLHDLTLKHAKSTFPVTVGASIFGVDANSFASNGRAFGHIVTPQSDRSYDRSLQKDPVSMAYSFSSKFPGYTSANLETRGVHRVDMKRFVLITADHPLVSAISENSERLQLGDVASMPEGLIKVSSALFEALLPMVKQQVSSQIRVRDFSDAQISIAPAEHQSWGSVREALVQERLEPRRRQLNNELRAALTDEDRADVRANFTVDQAAIEAEVDSTKHDLHLEIEVSYNFLSNQAQSP